MEFPEKIMKELEESDKQIERGQVYDAREVFKKFEDRYGY